jgi:hypothetical protein
MGFSGGGSNVLLPHTHDGRVSQDGGPLNFSNITQSQSAAGEVFYSDGTALQQLVLGAASDELRVNAGATAPEWYTPAAAASAFEELANVTETSGTSITTPVFTEKKYLMIWSFLNVSAGMSFRVGNTALDTLNNYAQTEMTTDGTTVATGAQAARSNLECFYNTGGICLVTANIVNIAAQQKVMDISVKGMAASSTGGIKNFGGLWYNSTDMIDIVSWYGSTITEANIVVWGRD